MASEMTEDRCLLMMTHLEGFADEFVMVGQVGPAVDAGVGPVAGGQILAECLRHLRAKNKLCVFAGLLTTFLCSSYAPPGSELLAGPVLPMLGWSAAAPPGAEDNIRSGGRSHNISVICRKCSQLFSL